MRKLILIFSIIFVSGLVKASECYHYHTSITTKLVIKGNRVYYQITEKDPNGFTYVRQNNKLLKGIDVASFKLYGEDETGFVFADKTGVYSLNKEEQYEENTAKFYKILNGNEGLKNINGRLFLINGKWTSISSWHNEIKKIVLPDLPINIFDIKSWNNVFYVKDDKQVYAVGFDIYETKKYQITVLPGLSPNETVYYACLQGLNQDYLADKNTMFSIRTDGSFEDITPQLLALGFNGGFNNMKLIDANIPVWQIGNLILKKRDGASSTRTNPLTGEDFEVEYAYSSATLLIPLSGRNSYVFFKNHIYPIWDDNFSLPSQIKVSASQLVAVEDNLFRGIDSYYMGNADNYKLANIGISSKAKFYPTIASYSRYLPKALVDDNFIYLIGERFDLKLGSKKALASKVVKQLGSFYLFNHALYDGNKNFPIKADEETLSYLGSFAEVINGCEGDVPNTPQVEVVYHHFFKDENSVYYFNNKSNKWQVIQTANEADYKADDYEALQALYQIRAVKGSVKKKSSEVSKSLNYALIGGTCILIIAFALLYYKKIKNEK